MDKLDDIQNSNLFPKPAISKGILIYLTTLTEYFLVGGEIL